jgi:hypothetical protein
MYRLIFGVAAAPNLVKLFDARTYDKGAFATFRLEEKAPRTMEFTGLKCSPDGITSLYTIALSALLDTHDHDHNHDNDL